MSLSRQLAIRTPACRLRTTVGMQSIRMESTGSEPQRFNSRQPPQRGKALGFVVVALLGGGLAWWASSILNAEDKAPSTIYTQGEVEFEKRPRQPTGKEDARDILSSQHLQVKNSWERPGVYAWGSNAGRVVAPGSNEQVVKTPRRIPFFDGKLLRDLKLDRDFGVAVTEDGDILQWGVGYSASATQPVATLTGKDIVKVALSKDRIIALSAGGAVYTMPVSQQDQQQGEKMDGATGSSWFPFWSRRPSAETIHFRTLKPANGLGRGERVVDISSGLEHCLLLTNKGRVFSAASSSDSFPAKGELGIAGLTWHSRPAGPYDQPHELVTLRGLDAVQIATGDHHSLVLDRQGRVFVFGDNSSGQLGFPVDPETAFVDTPALLAPFEKLYAASGLTPRITSVAAGGANSFFTVEASPAADGQQRPSWSLWGGGSTPATAPAKVADTWACGHGIHGTLGTGRWTHVSEGPTKIKALSGLSEYDERAGRSVPIRLARFVVGATHAAAVLANATSVSASAPGSTGTHTDTDTNYGADVVWWGGNEFYQLGTGRRNNAAMPVYIAPLDAATSKAGSDKQSGSSKTALSAIPGNRLQVTPRTTTLVGGGDEGSKPRKADVEQRVECGRFVSAIYSGTWRK